MEEMREQVGIPADTTERKFIEMLFDPDPSIPNGPAISDYGCAIKAHARIDAICLYLDELVVQLSNEPWPVTGARK